MSFAQLNLSAPISKAIAACGYNQPTPVQQRAIPEILAGADMVVSAQTGTGKTAAFVLPALHRLSLSESTLKPRVLILTPTRELASQITDAVSKYGKFLQVKIARLVGGMPYRQQLRDLSKPVDVIVATPGRLLDHMQQRKVDLSAIEMLILDEADRMLDMGFIDDVKEIAKFIPKARQTLLFSATVDNRLTPVINQILKNPVRIDLSSEKISPSQIKQELYLADSLQHKQRLLQHFINNENIFKAIIFSATKIGADNLANQLRKEGHAVSALHGDLKQNVRNRTVEELRRGKLQYIVATDVAARGIDIRDVTHVFNYDMPRFSEDYVHRIGRTGRAGKNGVAISFAMPSDLRHLQRIERFIDGKIKVETIAGLEPTLKRGSGKSADHEPKRRGRSSREERSFGGGHKGKSFSKDKSSRGERSFGGGYKGRSSDKDKSPREERSFGGGYKGRSSDKDKSPREERSFGGGYKGRSSDKDRSPRGERSFGGGYKGRSSDKDKSPREERSFGGGYKRKFSDRDSSPRGEKSFDGGYKRRFADKDKSSRGERSFDGDHKGRSSNRDKLTRQEKPFSDGYKGRSFSKDKSPREERSFGGGYKGKSADKDKSSRGERSFSGGFRGKSSDKDKDFSKGKKPFKKEFSHRSERGRN